MLILTPNNLAAKNFLQKKNLQKIKSCNVSWGTPKIFSLNSWLRVCWETISENDFTINFPALLNKTQISFLWSQVIENSAKGSTLLQIRSTAELARSTWNVIQNWKINIHSDDFIITEEAETFREWANDFQIYCKKNNFIDSESLLERIILAIQNQQIRPPTDILLDGFTDITPLQELLFTTLTENGCQIHSSIKSLKNPNLKASQISFNDYMAEIRSMALWSKSLFQKYGDTKNIACVIPNLDMLAGEVENIFSEIFTPQDTVSVNKNSLPFNIFYKKRLIDWPIIRIAILLCEKALIGTLTSEQESRLVHSPFITNNKNDFTYYEKNLSPSEWVDLIINYLSMHGWPKSNCLNNHDQQICAQWFTLLDEYSTLDCLVKSQSAKNAFSVIKDLTRNTYFQPNNVGSQSIKIIDLDNLLGQSFDYMWIMNMDDSQWPKAVSPNSLIPQIIQQKLKIPRSNPKLELLYWKNIFLDLQNSASNIIYSYSKQYEGNTLRASPFLKNIIIASFEELKCCEQTSRTNLLFSSSISETFIDSTAPDINLNEDIKGGAYILSQQAKCPFKAFVEIRLHAKPKDPESIGLDAKSRGNILHAALEILWNKIGDSEKLAEISDTAIKKLCDKAASKAIHLCTNKFPTENNYLKIELDRLVKLCLSWLVQEKNRPPFKVLGCEQKINIKISKLNLSLRLDRIDKLEDGSQMIIDYKTGKTPSYNNWLGDRPTEPQMPLYCISAASKSIKALAFGTVHPEKISFSGISGNETGINKLKKINQWSSQIDSWQETLTKLADSFCNGDAFVDPKEGGKTCEHCQLHSICRIHELEL